jgi:hypothetical protein
MQAPAGDAGDFLTAYGTTFVLVVPEKAKNFRTPKCRMVKKLKRVEIA